jgi:hypothetical protein
MGELNEIGKSYNCDKSDNHHEWAGETYFDIYEKYFSKFKNKEINLLELGVRDGASLRTWASYFTKATIHGVDIDPTSKIYQTPQFQIHTASQDDEAKLNALSGMVGGWDIVIDDASHINTLTVKSFYALISQVKSGGLYIIEDLRNSYEDLTEDAKGWDGMKYNESSILFYNERKVIDELLLSIIMNLDYRTSNIRSVHFHQQIVVIEKI